VKAVKTLTLVLCLFVLTGTLHSQNKRFQLKGKVLNRQSLAPVRGATIVPDGLRKGSVSGQDGEFSIFIYHVPVYLNIAHVGYEAQKIWIDTVTTSITILLNTATVQLREVEVKAVNPPQAFFRDEKYSVLDYECDSNRIYLLIYRFRLNRSELLCKSLEGDTLARSGPLPFKPTGLFRDCIHYIHLMGNDSVYQVCLRGDSIKLRFPSDMNHFQDILASCIASTDSMLFFRKESRDQLSIEFYKVHRRTSQKQLLSMVSDEEKLKMLRRSPSEYRYVVMKDAPRNTEEDLINDDPATMYAKALNWQWLKKIMYRSNQSSLQKIDELLCVCNTSDNTLEIYTLDGDFTSRLKMPVEEIGKKQWTTEIYVDDIYSKAYTSFLKSGGYFSLYRINLNTGELRFVIGAEHGFPRKVRIHKGFMFYLYDTPGGGANRQLFRQKL